VPFHAELIVTTQSYLVTLEDKEGLAEDEGHMEKNDNNVENSKTTE